MQETKVKKTDYDCLPKLDYLYDDDLDNYPLGSCFAIAVRILTDSDDTKIFFDLGDEA